MAENKVTSTVCGNSFKFLKNLRAHIKIKHPLANIDSVAPTNKIKTRNYMCSSVTNVTNRFAVQEISMNIKQLLIQLRLLNLICIP
jgi:hypothetical protein